MTEETDPNAVFFDPNTNTNYSQLLAEVECKLLHYAYTQLDIKDGEPKDTAIDYLLKIKTVMLEAQELQQQNPELATPFFVRMLGQRILDFVVDFIAPLYDGTSPNTPERIEEYAKEVFIYHNPGRPPAEMDIPAFFNAVRSQMKLGVKQYTPEHVVAMFKNELMTNHEKAGGVCGQCGSQVKCTDISGSIDKDKDKDKDNGGLAA